MIKKTRFLTLGILLVCLLVSVTKVYGQQTTITGTITDNNNKPLAYAAVGLANGKAGTETSEEGKYTLTVPANKEVLIFVRFLGYKTAEKKITPIVGKANVLNFKLTAESRMLNEATVTDRRYENRKEISLTKIDPNTAIKLPSPFGDFNRILATLPGVISNNELSSQYSVRGGNFDENLVYVNDIEIYRPMLVSAGQQEGLSFINPELVSDVEFSAGGWQPRFGDKLSSVLNVKYRVPEEFGGSASAGLLTNRVHIEGATKNKKVSFMGAFRQKSGNYLYNDFLFFRGLEVEGEYFPNFIDFQGVINADLTTQERKEKGGKTYLNLLLSQANNDYYVRPTARESTFGTLQNAFRLFMAFEGEENLFYNTSQGGIKLSHRVNTKFKTDWILSGVLSQERELFNIEAGYRLCDVQTDPSKPDFNECIFTRGVGTLFNYGRNELDANIVTLETKNYYLPTPVHQFEWGARIKNTAIDDKMNEYRFIDSAEYVEITDTIFTENKVEYQNIEFYGQHSINIGAQHTITYGARFNYWTFNNEFLVSPRIQYAYATNWDRDLVFKAAAGMYQQPAFYREMRNFNGLVNRNITAQKSYHFIAAADYYFKIWERDFKFVAEAYYKSLYDVIPYDVDDVRLRYYGDNIANAYAMGLDLRISGEFIPGEQSWFSLGIMDTKEDLTTDNRGYINRPTRQLITLGVFFQDHLPNDPTIKGYLNLVAGTGLPVGPPNNLALRNQFTMSPYRRVDVGFSKEIAFFEDSDKKIAKYLKSIWIGLDILNLLGVDNQISAIWIQDVQNNLWAVPNTSSQRFVNLRATVRF